MLLLRGPRPRRLRPGRGGRRSSPRSARAVPTRDPCCPSDERWFLPERPRCYRASQDPAGSALSRRQRCGAERSRGRQLPVSIQHLLERTSSSGKHPSSWRVLSATRACGQPASWSRPTLCELRYGALVAGWAPPRRDRLEEAIRSTTVVPVTDALLTVMAELRHACRVAGHPLHDRAHANDLWIAASAIHVDARLLTADSVFSATPGLTLHE